MRIGMLGSGLIANFYASALQEKRSRDQIVSVYSRTEKSVQAFAKQWNVTHLTTDIESCINHEAVDVVVIGLPNHLHLPAVKAVAASGKPVLCTKPLGRNADEALEMLKAVEEAGIFAGTPVGMRRNFARFE